METRRTKRSRGKWEESVSKKVLKEPSKVILIHPDELRFEKACSLISTGFSGNFNPYNPPTGLFSSPLTVGSRGLKGCDTPNCVLYLDLIFTPKG